ncbi:MAG TPA: hypothetical protein K8V56_20005 [Sporosarcina psychrophila]|uniref:Uncharacterized protein n=1 Tax=Sporosarcina psychrophila TaxID=1476 RepID=A0A921G3U3_SPOPS|nr:hypothetical protein [Sporosarcina psychrophila]
MDTTLVSGIEWQADMAGLYALFSIAVIITFVGGGPGMISTATGVMALAMVLLVKRAWI